MTIERPEDTIARYESEFGHELGLALYAFLSRLIELHRRWRDYETLYSSDARVQVLNKGASSFFARHQQMTFECVVMALARLTDPERTGAFENLSLAYLRSLLEPALKAQLKPFADDAQAKAAFARAWRNKRFAHHDLGDALDQAVAVAPATHQEIDEAIVALNRFVEQVHLKCGGYSKFPLEYAYRSNDFGGALVLLRAIYQANKARDKRLARIESKQARPEDWEDVDDPIWRELSR
jgi:AbiU2